MAIFREPNICPFCGEEIMAIYDKQEGVPFMFQRIGDNFLRYEDHVCDPKKKAEYMAKHKIVWPESDFNLDFLK